MGLLAAALLVLHRDAIKAFQDIGTDELTFSPGVPDLDQVERLADIVG